MPYTFVFVGGLRDGFQVASDAQCLAERLIANSLWSSTQEATVGEPITEYRSGGRVDSPIYRVVARTAFEDDVIVTCSVPSLA